MKEAVPLRSRGPRFPCSRQLNSDSDSTLLSSHRYRGNEMTRAVQREQYKYNNDRELSLSASWLHKGIVWQDVLRLFISPSSTCKVGMTIWSDSGNLTKLLFFFYQMFNWFSRCTHCTYTKVLRKKHTENKIKNIYIYTVYINKGRHTKTCTHINIYMHMSAYPNT